jgi:hypothetical protein
VLAALPAVTEASAGDERLPKLDKSGVVVPWEDFKKILDEIRRVEPPVVPEPPPVDFASSGCDVRVDVDPENERARVALELSIQVLNPDGWVEIPVIREGPALSRFTMDGRPANVYRKNGMHHVALKGAGRHALSLEYTTQVADSRGTHSTHLMFPPAPVISLDLRIPQPDLDVNVGGAVVRSVERTPTSTRVRAAFQQAHDAPITWFKKVELDEKETKVLAELRTLISVGEGMLRGTAVAAFTVHGRGVDRFRLAFPADVTVLDVSAQGIRDWKVEKRREDDREENLLTVNLSYRAQGNYSFQVGFEKQLEGTSAETSAPDVAILDVLRDKGFIAVAAATNVEINPVGELKNATPVDPAELPDDLTMLAREPVLYSFKYLQHPVEIGLRIVKHEDLTVKRTIVESARLFSYLSPEGKLITSATYSVKNNRKQYLEATLPDGGEVWGVYLENRPVKAARTEQGRVLVPLKKTAANAAGELEAFDVELVYFQQQDTGFWGSRSFAGPALDVDALEAQWHLFLPRDKRYSDFGGNLHPDDQLNRILYLETAAYNLESDKDVSLLRAETVGGKTVVTDGKNAGRLDDLRFEVGSDEAEPSDEDLRRLGARADRPAMPEEEQLFAEPSAAPAPPPRKGAKRQKLEEQIDNLVQRQMPIEDGEGLEFRRTQVAMSNVAAGQQVAAAAKGVLPVRFNIPMDGLRLSFTGRLLTAKAGDAPTVTMSYRPLTRSLPASVLFLSFLVLALAALLLVVGAEADSSRGPLRIVLGLVAVLVMAALFWLHPGARVAFFAGLALAAALFLLIRYRNRRVVAAWALLLLAVTVGGLTADATETKPPTLPNLSATEITLTWSDFKALVEQTYVPPPVGPTPPAEAFLRTAEYRGKLAPGVLTLEGTLVLEVLKDGWIRLPLWSQGSVIRFEGGPALLNRSGSQLEALTRGPGTFELKATIAFEATDRPGVNTLAFKLPPAPRNLLALTVDPSIRDVEVASGLSYRSEQGRIFAAVPDGAVAIKYALPFLRTDDDAGQEVKLEPRVHLTAYQLLDVGEGVLTGRLIHDYQVRVADVSHFDIDLPDDIVIFECGASGLESWKILERDGQRFVRVKLLTPVSGMTRVTVQFEGAYDAEGGSVTVPRFVPQDVERESGFVGVAAEGSEVELELTGKLLPADVSEIPADVAALGGNMIRACKYSGPPDAASIRVTEHDDAAVLTAIIQSLNATAVLLENGTEANWIDLVVKNNRKQFLKLTLPAEVEIWSLLIDGQPAKPKRTGDSVLVSLPRGGEEVTSRASLVLLRQGPALGSFGQVEPYLPSFDIPVSEALWTVYLPRDRRYTVGTGPFRQVQATAPLLPAMGKPSAPASGVAALGYADAVSKQVAESQMQQEADVAQELKQQRRRAYSKGALPVRIGLPGGIQQLPRITVSRMLIVVGEDNRFSIRAYPSWLAAGLRYVQWLLLLVAGIWFGFNSARRLGRRAWIGAALVGVLGLIPLAGIRPPAALLMMLAVAVATRLAMAVAGWLRDRAAPPPDPEGAGATPA